MEVSGDHYWQAVPIELTRVQSLLNSKRDTLHAYSNKFRLLLVSLCLLSAHCVYIKVPHPLTRNNFFWRHKSNNYGSCTACISSFLPYLRDMFVDENLRPQLRRGLLDSMMDDTDLVCPLPPSLRVTLWFAKLTLIPFLQPTQEVLEKVFEFRKNSLQRLCFK